MRLWKVVLLFVAGALAAGPALAQPQPPGGFGGFGGGRLAGSVLPRRLLSTSSFRTS